MDFFVDKPIKQIYKIVLHYFEQFLHLIFHLLRLKLSFKIVSLQYSINIKILVWAISAIWICA